MLKNLVDVKAAAKHFKVNPLTVNEWIRGNKIPARKNGKKWWMRKEDIEKFENNGHKFPGEVQNDPNNKIDIFDPEESAGVIPLDQLRTPNTFANTTAKGGWCPVQQLKLPHEFQSRMAQILERNDIYGRNYAHFMTAACYNLILDEEQRAEEETGEKSAEWEAWDVAKRVEQRQMINDKVVKSIQDAVKTLSKNAIEKDWLDFLEKTLPNVEAFDEPWKTQAFEAISSYGQDETAAELG